MKKYKFYTLTLLSFLMCYACNEHDTIDDNVFVGEMAPQVDWTVSSTTVSSGTEVDFSSEYYTTGEATINRAEVWYNVIQTEIKEVGCSWVTSQTYLQSSEVTEEIRLSQKISEYPHNLSHWDNDRRAFQLSASFPTSYTLSSISWSEPTSFGAEDSTTVKKYFSESFMQTFKDELYTKMQFDDFRNMYLGLSLLDDFSQYTDSTFNPNSNIFEYHFPKDQNGEEVIPEIITSIYETIPFSQLIFNSSKALYAITYKKSYSLKAVIKVVDDANNVGLAREVEISLN